MGVDGDQEEERKDEEDEETWSEMGAHMDWDEMDDDPVYREDVEPSAIVGKASATGMWRFELEVIPSDSETEMQELFQNLKALPGFEGVEWLGWRSEPFYFGMEKLVPIATIDEKIHTNAQMTMQNVIEAATGLEPVESCHLISSREYVGDPFQVCSRMFIAPPGPSDGVPESLKPQTCTAEDLRKLMRSGYVVIDKFVNKSVADEVYATAKASLVNYPEFLDDGIDWILKEPREVRGDVSLTMDLTKRPATDKVFVEEVVPHFRKLQQDLRLLVPLQDCFELQLGWYPGDGKGYEAHFDDVPPDDEKTNVRRMTAIVYCNSDWKQEDGGEIRIWTQDHEGCRILDVEPLAGRILIFLSGCVRHEVRPCYAARCALTCWLR